MYANYIIWQYLAYKLVKRENDKIDFDVIHHTTWGNFKAGTYLWKLKKTLIFGHVEEDNLRQSLLKNIFMNIGGRKLNVKD